MAKQYLYGGSWLDETGKAGGGIRLYGIQENGDLELVEYTAQDIAAGYLAFSPDKKTLYTVNEIKRRPDSVNTEGSIYALAVDEETGRLTERNHISSCGANPNYLALSPDGRLLYAVNYGSEDVVIRSRKDDGGKFLLEQLYEEASMIAMDIRDNGNLGEVRELYVYSGAPSGYFKWFQASPHPHCIGVDPAGTMILVADRGCDSILTCHYDRDQKKFCDIHINRTSHGFGPRNCAFHPTLPYVFVVGEVKPLVTVYRYSAQTAEITRLNTCYTAEEGLEYCQEGEFFAFSHPSDIKIHPDGKVLYVANRGPDLIRCFRISENGELFFMEDVPSEGRFPWSMEITPDGKYLYVGNKQSGNICGFSVDETGIPHYNGRCWKADRIVCLKCVRF